MIGNFFAYRCIQKVVLSFGLYINDKTQQWPVPMHAFDAEPSLVDKKTSTVLHPYPAIPLTDVSIPSAL
jgi:hypothetical protein